MSIIAEALKKAEEEKDRKLAAKEYLDKIVGPERKERFKPEEHFLPTMESTLGKKKSAYLEKKKILVVSGTLLLLAIIFLTIANVFILPSSRKYVATFDRPSGTKELPLKAEAYSDARAEIALIENKAVKASKGDLIQTEFSLNFKLNGIVYDAENSWAVINNKIARTGDTLDGATVISISPKRVALLFKNELFDLHVK